MNGKNEGERADQVRRDVEQDSAFTQRFEDEGEAAFFEITQSPVDEAA